MARAHRDSPLAEALASIADEIAEDRESLLGVMRRLEVPTRRYTVWAAGAAEWLGRLKSNGRLFRRSPLTSVVELEFLRLGVEGKAAGWGTMRPLADADERLDEAELDELIERARRQKRVLEELRLRQAQEVFRTGEGEQQVRGESVESPR
ncbi:hypothetical protein ABT124_44540 [Streptomyces sp. NPDC001982]|uniref:hypothetical protein n=1 Tax=Streptomyces sp. NPDC001982 TaxID=3154405 RepID=UPI0033190309